MRNKLPLAALTCTGITLGAALAWTVPTELHPSPNAELERLSHVRVVSYPGADRVVSGPDSYPVTYSPQWLAVAQAAERERMARYDLPDFPQPVGYGQPSPEQDMAMERQGLDEPGQLAEAGTPDG